MIKRSLICVCNMHAVATAIPNKVERNVTGTKKYILYQFFEFRGKSEAFWNGAKLFFKNLSQLAIKLRAHN